MYKDTITQILSQIGFSKVDPRHIEAYMRIEHSTLDGLSMSQFKREVTIAKDCVLHEGPDMAERLAKSFGL